MDLNIIWFILITVLFTGYAILDGFDLGAGILHLFAKSEKERRLYMNSIGPLWDGNEVWLITGGGALFAAFPIVYSTVFSGFYIALMLLLTALIFRAVSFDFRGKVESSRWRTLWDWAFSIGSLIATLLFGIAFGNILRGIPIDANGNFTGTFLGLLNIPSLLVGLTTIILFTLHGALYLIIKTEGELQERLITSGTRSWIGFVVLYVITTLTYLFSSSFLFENILSYALFWILFILLNLSFVMIPIFTSAKKHFSAFLSSSILIFCIIGLSGLSLFPKLVPSITDLSNSLTIYNASSSKYTLNVMLYIALIGMPIVIAYTAFIYKVFKGKVEVTKESY